MNSLDIGGHAGVQRVAEAAVWVARLHGPARNPNMEQALRHWLRAHPGNAFAFERVTQVWEESAALQRRLQRRSCVLTVRRCLLWMLAAMLLAALLLMI